MISSAVLSHLRALRRVGAGIPWPLGYWTRLRTLLARCSAADDPLSPPESFNQSTGAQLCAPELRAALSDEVLGLWSLDSGTLDLLWNWIRVHRPRVSIECGAGLSTVVLATYAASQAAGDAAVFSLEQDARVKEQISARLRKNGLAATVDVLEAPLSPQHRYELNVKDLSNRLGARRADLLLIDGPSGRPGCRAWTLPLLAPLCRPGAVWFLDDAFRDGELLVLNAWKRVRGIAVAGIHPIGKGLGVGRVTDPHLVSFDAVADAIATARSHAPWSARIDMRFSQPPEVI